MMKRTILLSLAALCCALTAAAQDLTAQVFEKVLRRLPDYRPSGAPFEAWLFAVARNTVTDWQRAQRLRHSLPWEALRRLRDPDPLPEAAALHSEERTRLKAALAGLSDSIAVFARAEGLEAHARAALIRKEAR